MKTFFVVVIITQIVWRVNLSTIDHEALNAFNNQVIKPSVMFLYKISHVNKVSPCLLNEVLMFFLIFHIVLVYTFDHINKII